MDTTTFVLALMFIFVVIRNERMRSDLKRIEAKLDKLLKRQQPSGSSISYKGAGCKLLEDEDDATGHLPPM